jgi:NAD(P)-dependent dehydrogenase (short-subunit alcohol dehydrogenase family)
MRQRFGEEIVRLAGRVAIVTGGSQGIGEAIARAFAREGAAVAILNRTVEKGRQTAAAIVADGGKAEAVACDVSRFDSMRAALAEVHGRFGGVDILVNNAAAYFLTPLGDTREDAIDAMLDANIKGVFLLSQLVLPDFEKKGGGRIINIGSIFGHDGFPGSAIYCATKGAIHLMTKALAVELRDRNIQINAIAPGWVETPMNAGYRASNEEFMRRAKERFGGEGGWMQPDEIAGAAVFLASAESRSVTGTVLFVDRGWSAY